MWLEVSGIGWGSQDWLGFLGNESVVLEILEVVGIVIREVVGDQSWIGQGSWHLTII